MKRDLNELMTKLRANFPNVTFTLGDGGKHPYLEIFVHGVGARKVAISSSPSCPHARKAVFRDVKKIVAALTKRQISVAWKDHWRSQREVRT